MDNFNISRDSNDTTTSSSQFKEYQGYLMFRKKQAFTRTWKHRFIVFRAPYIYVYNSHKDARLLYQYDITEYDTVTNDPTNKRSQLGVVIFASRKSLQPQTAIKYPILHFCAIESENYCNFMTILSEYMSIKKLETIDRMTGRVTSLMPKTTSPVLSNISEFEGYQASDTSSEDRFYSQGNQTSFDFQHCSYSFNHSSRKYYSQRKNSVHY